MLKLTSRLMAWHAWQTEYGLDRMHNLQHPTSNHLPNIANSPVLWRHDNDAGKYDDHDGNHDDDKVITMMMMLMMVMIILVMVHDSDDSSCLRMTATTMMTTVLVMLWSWWYLGNGICNNGMKARQVHWQIRRCLACCNGLCSWCTNGDDDLGSFRAAGADLAYARCRCRWGCSQWQWWW